MKYLLSILGSFVIGVQILNAQFVVKGRVTDAETGEGMPFVTVFFKGTFEGTTSDFEGFYTIEASKLKDSISASYLGFETRTKDLSNAQTQQVNFQLKEQSFGLDAIEITAGENPALAIVRNAIAMKSIYNKSNLTSYEYESYSKIQLSVDNISDKFGERKIFKPVSNLYDSLNVLAGEDGEAVLPVLQTETISRLYYQKDPKKRREDIIASNVYGVAIRGGDVISQFTGASFQEYSFYDNRILIVDKEFLSPLADAALVFYDFFIIDSVLINTDTCYKLQVRPKNDQDLAFTGFIWISKNSWKLVQVDLEITKKANLNWIKDISVKQTLTQCETGELLPEKTRMVVDIIQLGKNTVGTMAKFYFSVDSIKINQTKEEGFFEKNLVLKDDALTKDTVFWSNYRHDPLTTVDEQGIKMIDSLSELSLIRNVVSAFYIFSTGYFSTRYWDFGPIPNIISLNVLEGARFNLGGRTNIKFSDKWILSGYLAYGTRDQKFKHQAKIDFIASRDPFTRFSLERKDDISQNGIAFNFGNSSVFGTSRNNNQSDTSNILEYAKINKRLEHTFSARRELSPWLTTTVSAKNIRFNPIASTLEGVNSINKKGFNTSEFALGLNFTPKSYSLFNDNERVNLGSLYAPVFITSYTLGVEGIAGSEFNYQKVGLVYRHRLRLGVLGYSRYSFTGGKIFTSIPFPLLAVHPGNQTLFFKTSSYNLMNFFEFISDEYVEFKIEHHFQGIFLNRIPVLRKLKFREVAGFRALAGRLSNLNDDFQGVEAFSTLEKKPYMEANLGVENILYIFRIDAVYRLSYIDKEYVRTYQLINPGININRFGFKISAAFSF
ncbi:MAG: hypothetical protein ACJAZ3_000255 [Sphingobacteriales bacterium]